MTNFLYDELELPLDKIDNTGGSAAVSNPTRRWSPNDANRVMQALRDIQSDMARRTFNVRGFGAEVDNSTDDGAALLDAIDKASATANGAYGAAVVIPQGTLITTEKAVVPNGVAIVGAGGPGGPASVIKAHSSFSDTALITNELQTGTQEYAFLQGLIVDGNKGSGAVCSSAVVDWVSLFVNSSICDCIIQEGSNIGLRIAADGTPGGMGPILVQNCWVARNTGHNVYVEDTAGNTGAATGVVFVNLTSENQGTNKSAIYLKGAGRLAGVRFIGTTHIEMGDATKTGKTGITVDGCAHTSFENVQLLANAASVSFGIDILNVVQNVGIQFENVYNPNLIATVLRDQKNSVTLGAINVNNYRTADWTSYGAPRYAPVSGGKSVVFQSSALTDRAWFDANGRLTGASVNGAGLDILSDATNDRPLSLINAALDRVFDLSFPSGGGGVLRMTYRTGGVSVMQIGTDGTIFHYESPTFQKNATFQQGLRLQAELAPAQITSNQNDYNPTGLSTTSTLLLTSDAARDITGFAAPANGIVLWVYNNGAQNITLKHQSASSSAANRIIGTAGADVVLTPNRGAMLRYSNSQTRWIVMTDNL